MTRQVNSQAKVAFALGVTKQNVTQWKQAGCPWLKKPPFDIDKIAEWRDQNVDQTKASRGKTDDRLELIDRTGLADAEIKELTANKMKWEAAVREQKLVYAEDWDKVLATQAEAFRREICGMEFLYASEFLDLKTTEQAATKLREIATKILKKLHEGD